MSEHPEAAENMGVKMEICAVVMAAGEGKKMRSRHSKVVLRAAGKPLILWVEEALSAIGAREQLYIVGHRQEEVRAVLGERFAFVLQERALGTGHAVMQAAPFLESRGGVIAVLPGDAPLITPETLQAALTAFEEQRYDALVITSATDKPTGYGRVVRNENGLISRIVEEEEATEEEKGICDVNSSFYFFKTPLLLSALGKLAAHKRNEMYYLTDTVEQLIDDGYRVGEYVTDFDEIRGVNDRVELQAAGKLLNHRICRKLMLDGVQIIDPDSTWIDPKVSIGMDTVIRANTVIKGECTIGEDCIIGPQTRLENVRVGNETMISNSVATDCVIGEECSIGPFSHIRPGSVLGNQITIGAFVEVKNSTLGDYTRARHLTYIGDAEVGKNVNFGGGVVTCNYDGEDKSACKIGDNVFVGGNASIISPVVLCDDSYVAAGSTITEDVPELSLAIARSKQTNKEKWVVRRNRIRIGKYIPPEKEFEI